MNLPRDAVPSTPLGVCLASDWQSYQPGEQRRSEVPLWTCPASSGLQRAPWELWPVLPRERQGPVGPGAAVASLTSVSKSAFSPGSMATAGSKTERREEASKGRATCGPGNHRVWLLAGVALQVRCAPEVGGALSARVPPTTACGPCHSTTQPIPGPGPLGANIGKPYLASTASGLGCLWARMSRQVDGQPGGPDLTGELRAVRLEIPVREKLSVVIT